MAETSTDNSGRTRRFERKREDIILAASQLINEVGVRGMTFLDVANRVGLTTTSVTYYFQKKDLLAEAAFGYALDHLEAIVEEAGAMPTPQERVARVLELELDDWAARRAGKSSRRAQLSEIRTLDDPVRTRLSRRFVAIVRRMRDFFGPENTAEQKTANLVRAHVLMENLFWLPTWLPNYSSWEFARVHHYMMDLLTNGIAGKGGSWNPRPLKERVPDAGEPMQGGETFLSAATRLINTLGYRGASVNRIASELKLTKGSFYHYLESKDELVVRCFQRTYDRVSFLQQSARTLDVPMRDALASVLEKLLEIQFRGDLPLLRFSNLHALPPDPGRQVTAKASRIARRHAAMLTDGMADGSIRPLDAAIAGRMISVAVNSALVLRGFALERYPTAPAHYGRILAHGMFD